MTALAIEVDRVINRLSPPAREELEKAVRAALSRALRKSAWNDVPKDSMGYPVGHFEATVGSFADEPLEIAADLPMTVREDW